MSLPNVWHHRRVADGSAKACWICYKPSTSVLITPDSKDFFYICMGHLKDRNFCTPDKEEADAAEALKQKEALEKEIEKVKQEYEEKQKRKQEKKKEKEKEEGKDKDKEKDKAKEDKKEADETKADEQERDAKIKSLQEKEPEGNSGPRVFSLHKNFYQMRTDRIRNAEMAKRNKERLKNPSYFPSVPGGDPGAA